MSTENQPREKPLAEFTKVYAETYGSRVRPHRYAVKVERKEIELPSLEIFESSK